MALAEPTSTPTPVLSGESGERSRRSTAQARLVIGALLLLMVALLFSILLLLPPNRDGSTVVVHPDPEGSGVKEARSDTPSPEAVPAPAAASAEAPAVAPAPVMPRVVSAEAASAGIESAVPPKRVRPSARTTPRAPRTPRAVVRGTNGAPVLD